jgi:seryl-tRNA synthetase
MEPIVETQAQTVAIAVAAAVRETAAAVAVAVRETATAAAQVKENESGTAITEIKVLKTEMGALKDQLSELKATVKEIFAKLDEINKGRLPWSATAIIAILTMACGVLATMAVLR